MKISLLITLCCVLFLCTCGQVLAEGENEIKRGAYPFMAFLYYPDESVVEVSGARFLRGAVLVKPKWLITSSVGPATINDAPHGFPRKTLLARLGALAIDLNYTLNEEEDEQEREIIQIVRPSNQSSTQWWRTDITLLKTLLPFNITSAVATGTLRKMYNFNDTSCFILVYMWRSGNWTEDRLLTQVFVDVLPESSTSCGNHFSEETMLCANDVDENKILPEDPDSCSGYSGGPLICENDITGIQTYVENNCKQPHLYQHLAAWESFITCGIEDNCHNEECSNMCIVTNKDDPSKGDISTEEPTLRVSQDIVTITEEITMPSLTNEVMHYDEAFTTPTTTTTITTTTTTTTTTQIVKEDPPTTTTTVAPTSENTIEETEQTSAWPKEKYPQHEISSEEEDKKIETRKTNVEAQQLDVKIKPKGAAERNMCYFQSLFSVFILACIV